MVIKKSFIENTTFEEKTDRLNKEKKAFPIKEIIKAKKAKADNYTSMARTQGTWRS